MSCTKPLLLTVFALLLASLTDPALAQCGCVGCTDTVSYSATGDHILAAGSCNTAGFVPVVSELRIASTDGSSFTVFTRSSTTTSEYYTAASAPNSVTCYNKGSANVGGSSQSIFVIVDCTNIFSSCPLRYDVELQCIQVESYSWSTGSWSPCSSSCSQTRSVTCTRDSDSESVSDSLCSAGSKPSTSQTCTGGSCDDTSSSIWAGFYKVDGQCSQRSCCCYTGIVKVTDNGFLVSIEGNVKGQCGGIARLTQGFNPDRQANSATFTTSGQSYTATRTSSGINIVNNDDSACSGGTVETTEAAWEAQESSTSSSSSSSDMFVYAGAGVAALALLVLAVWWARRRKQPAHMQPTSSTAQLARA